MSVMPCPWTEAITAKIASIAMSSATKKATPDKGSGGVGVHIAIVQAAHAPAPDTMPVNFPPSRIVLFIALNQDVYRLKRARVTCVGLIFLFRGINN